MPRVLTTCSRRNNEPLRFWLISNFSLQLGTTGDALYMSILRSSVLIVKWLQLTEGEFIDNKSSKERLLFSGNTLVGFVSDTAKTVLVVT